LSEKIIDKERQLLNFEKELKNWQKNYEMCENERKESGEQIKKLIKMIKDKENFHLAQHDALVNNYENLLKEINLKMNINNVKFFLLISCVYIERYFC
jgi:septal ring factor EnvC (AmiA/AmiB activator)